MNRRNPRREDRNKKIFSFDYEGVRLLNGIFKNQFEEMVEYYKNIPNDDILKGFRERKNKNVPGQNLGGWYTGDATFLKVCHNLKKPTNVFSTFGQWLSAYARIYRVTKDEEVKNKLEYLIHEWGKEIEPDGYFFYGNNPNSEHYEYDKIVGGLVDSFEFAGIEESLNYLSQITDWAIKHLNRRRIPPTPDNFTGGGHLGSGDSDTEWYTLSENLYRAYIVTEDIKYKEFAEVWHYSTYWDDIRKNRHCMTSLHAYSHVNNLGGAAMAFIVTGDAKYLQTIMNAYEIYRDTQFFATGGFGPWERMANQFGSLGNSLSLEERSFEVPCGSWATFKLSRYLISLTGKAEYGDWIEKILFNAIGAALPMESGGKTFYYADYRVTGGIKEYYQDLWPCCSGTYPLAITDYFNIIYFYDDSGIYVNQYIPSSVKWTNQNKNVELLQETNFPHSSSTKIKIKVSNSAEFAIRFRIPSWCKEEPKVKVNGSLIKQEWKSEQWSVIDRQWINGDTLEIDFPLSLKFLPVDERHKNLAALTYGPIVLASENEGPINGDKEQPSKWISLLDAERLIFQAHGRNGKTWIFKPFYCYQKGEKYYLYNLIDGD